MAVFGFRSFDLDHYRARGHSLTALTSALLFGMSLAAIARSARRLPGDSRVGRVIEQSIHDVSWSLSLTNLGTKAAGCLHVPLFTGHSLSNRECFARQACTVT